MLQTTCLVLFSKADYLLMFWDALWGGVIATAMFQWGRRYERKQAAKHWEPKEPTL